MSHRTGDDYPGVTSDTEGGLAAEGGFSAANGQSTLDRDGNGKLPGTFDSQTAFRIVDSFGTVRGIFSITDGFRSDPLPVPGQPTLSATPTADTVPIGTWDYMLQWIDSITGTSTGRGAARQITLSEASAVTVTPPAAPPWANGYSLFRSNDNGLTWESITAGGDQATPVTDTKTDYAGTAPDWTTFADQTQGPLRGQHIEVAGQIYTTNGKIIFSPDGSGQIAAALGEWNANPVAEQPVLTASRADQQAQIDELVALFVTKGTLTDSRTA